MKRRMGFRQEMHPGGKAENIHVNEKGGALYGEEEHEYLQEHLQRHRQEHEQLHRHMWEHEQLHAHMHEHLKAHRKASRGVYPLSMANKDSTLHVADVRGKEEQRRYLSGLGFAPGGEVRVVSEMGGNLIVDIKGARIALGRQLAHKIIVE